MTSMPDRFHQHASPEDMAEDMARQIADQLSNAIESRGQAVLAVSGGSTPKTLYQRLSKTALDWSKVVIVLVDERWVEPGEAGSNETFLHQTLLQNAAGKARFIGLKSKGKTPQYGLAEVKNRLSGLSLPFDVVVLGMGSDGHTASWFPHAKGLDYALDSQAENLAAIEAKPSNVTGEHTQRITLTRKAIMDANSILLMISGDAKRQVWNTACQTGEIADMPVRALLFDDTINLETHWAA